MLMFREAVDIQRLMKALPDVENDKTWGIADEDVEDAGVVCRAADMITHGDLMIVRDSGELGMEFVIVPEFEGVQLEPGFYRLIPLDAKSISNLEEKEGLVEKKEGSGEVLRSNRVVEDPYPGAHTPDQPIGAKAKILEKVFRNWDFSGNLPRPIMETLRCFCGNSEWHPRYWLFHDYKMQESNNPHRFRFRCDVSMKCAECGYVGVWGVVVPDEWWHRHDIYPRKVSWQEAAGMLKSGADGQSNN